MRIDNWKESEKEIVLSTKIFDVVRSERISKNGKKAEFYLVDAPDWVHVIPLIRKPEGEEFFIMVEQYRHGENIQTLEFPGGMVDEGERPEEAGLREFKEETGCTARKMTLLGKVNPNPAFMTNQSYTYLAEDIECGSDQNLDEHEDLSFRLVPVKDIIGGKERAFYHHAVMINALFWYMKNR
jgi:8-oxo-dGTP pyrophosphatase MutT (NUDIX family)